MRATVAQHKDISTVMLIALVGVIVYALFGLFLLQKQAQKQLFSQAQSSVAADLQK